MGPYFYTGDITQFRSNVMLLRNLDILRVSVEFRIIFVEWIRSQKILYDLRRSSNDLNIAEEKMLQSFSTYRYVKQYSDEYYPASDENPSGNENYIYVTYPPEIKRKLLDR